MKQEAKLLLGFGIITIGILVGAVFLLGGSSTPTPTSNIKADPKILVKSGSNKFGSESAKVTLVEFGDFQCPACALSYPIAKEIKTAYKDRIQFVFRNFPLPSHANALVAAQAAEAAGTQEKYWEMHDMLYENQSEWSSESNPLEIFVGYAKELELDVDKFKEEVQSSKYASKIQEDLLDGRSLGVNSTPTFYLNSEKIVGVVSYEDLKYKIDLLLK